MSLKARLAREIALTGPMTVADYVVRCLHDPQDGYYATRPALGEGGDFITAPLISQMFGELLGLWVVETWMRLGAPERFRLVEVGPGDGTLMEDALRAMAGAARLAPGLLEACDLILIEPSTPLRAMQAKRLANADPAPRWVASLDRIETDAPVVLIANEVLDCMPARQFVRTDGGWAERRVGVTEDGDLIFGLVAVATGFEAPDFDIEPGQVWEVSEQQAAFGRDLGRLIAETSGAALLIDYGRDRPEAGDTLQALKRHAKVDPLETPGEADLTQWADFPLVLEAAVRAGADVTGCRGQGDFLRALGIEARAERLAAARPDAAPVIARQLDRLTTPDQMGTLFKAAAIFSPHSRSIPGFRDMIDALQPITHPLLEKAGVRHGFFTRQGGVSTGLFEGLNTGLGSSDDPAAVAENRRRIADWFGRGPDDLAACYQIHSAITRVADGPWKGERPEGDATATAKPGVVCAVLTADCAPVLLADAEAGVVAAVHAGWKGALGGVVHSAVSAMQALGALPRRTVAVVGPCIAQSSYEVGADYQDRFAHHDPGSERFFRAGATPDKRLFDLPGFVLWRLEQAGVGEAAWTGDDTWADETRFYSNRRAFQRGEPDFGRLMSAISL